MRKIIITPFLLVLMFHSTIAQIKTIKRNDGSAQETKVGIIESIDANDIKLSASSSLDEAHSVNHLTDGSGIHGSIHDNSSSAATMWHTVVNPEASIPVKGLSSFKGWVRFDFSTLKSFNTIMIW